MKKRNASRKILRIISNLAAMEMAADSANGYPPCIGILYQPKRPVKKN